MLFSVNRPTSLSGPRAAHIPGKHKRSLPNAAAMTILGSAHIAGALDGHLAALQHEGITTLWALTSEMTIYDRVCSDAPIATKHGHKDFDPKEEAGLFWVNPNRQLVQVIATGCEWLLPQAPVQPNGLQLTKINTLMLSPEIEAIFHEPSQRTH